MDGRTRCNSRTPGAIAKRRRGGISDESLIGKLMNVIHLYVPVLYVHTGYYLTDLELCAHRAELMLINLGSLTRTVGIREIKYCIAYMHTRIATTL